MRYPITDSLEEFDDVDPPASSSVARWSLNGLLAMLGGVVLGIAFHQLDTRDDRPLYNPWTYVIVVPVALMAISTMLSTFVSRVVERSLQAAFLLSVLMHLLILTYAGNVVIFSRAWSEVFDQLASEHQQLAPRLPARLPMLQAKQYFQLSSTAGRSSAEDAHLRYAPTQFDANEQASIAKPDSPEPVDFAKLASNPEVEHTPTPTQHTPARDDQPSDSDSSTNDLAEGITRPALERATAGGLEGPAARNSQPVVGPESIASQNSSTDEALEPSSLPTRHDRLSRQAIGIRLPELGQPQSPEFNHMLSASRGTAGRAPSGVRQSNGDGDAASKDIAGLFGSGGDIQRAKIGMSRPQVDSSAEAHSRRVVVPPNALQASEPTMGNLSASRLALEGRRSQAESGASTPAGLESLSGTSTPLAPSGDTLSHSNRLARRADGNSELVAPTSIASVRIERSSVGDLRGPATSAAVPKPAFLQRLERLQKDTPEDVSPLEPQTELAIERGLEFLARHQRADGSWRLQDFDTDVLIRSDTAATALSLLAFQGAGYTHLQSKYAKTVERAIDFLASHQKADGDLYIRQDPASDQNAWLYSHSIASLALCEAFGMTQDERLKPVAQKAVDFMVASQDLRRGGWRYRPGIGSDTSVTGWYLMALQSGKLAGLSIPPETFHAIGRYVQAAQVNPNSPHLYRYNPFAPDTDEQRHGLQPTAVMTSVGLLIRLYTDWDREQPEMIRGADYLLQHIPQHGTNGKSMRDTYYWYYATQVIFHVGGDHWKRWHEALYPLLIENQETVGPMAGSWAPMHPVPDLWARYGGRLYVTTMNLLSLEVRYRHLPLYEATGGK